VHGAFQFSAFSFSCLLPVAPAALLLAAAAASAALPALPGRAYHVGMGKPPVRSLPALASTVFPFCLCRPRFRRGPKRAEATTLTPQRAKSSRGARTKNASSPVYHDYASGEDARTGFGSGLGGDGFHSVSFPTRRSRRRRPKPGLAGWRLVLLNIGLDDQLSTPAAASSPRLPCLHPLFLNTHPAATASQP